MSRRAEVAKEFFEKGYACSQAVAMAFADIVKVDEDLLAKMTLPFGGGFGRLRLVCGAVSGMTTIVGLVYSSSDAKNKIEVYEIEREICSRFEKEMGSLICADLLSEAGVQVGVGGTPEERTKEYYKKRPCAEIVYLAAKILEEYLEENKTR